MNYNTLPAVEKLAQHFFLLLKSSNGLAEFEGRAMEDVMGIVSAAMGQALGELDDWLLENHRVPGSTIHDRRERRLLAECGQVSFTRRVFCTQEGIRFTPLDEYLGIKPFARISPGAFDMVAKDALCDAYARAAEILCRHTHTSLSRQSVKNIIRQYAETYLSSDTEAARACST